MRTMTAELEKLLSPAKVAAIFGVSQRTTQRWAARGTIPAIRLPHTRGVFFRTSTIEALLASATATSRTEPQSV